MAAQDKRPVTLEDLLVSSLAQTDALAKLLIEKGQGVETEGKANCDHGQEQGGKRSLRRSVKTFSRGWSKSRSQFRSVNTALP
jgi:hypothetical protein